jgi:hypothetical protein
MSLIIKQDQPSRQQVRMALADLVEQEYAEERAAAAERDANAAWVAQNLHNGKTTVLGKCIAVVDLRDDIRLQQKYGAHMREKSFWKYFQKHHKEMCPAKI